MGESPVVRIHPPGTDIRPPAMISGDGYCNGRLRLIRAATRSQHRQRWRDGVPQSPGSVPPGSTALRCFRMSPRRQPGPSRIRYCGTVCLRSQCGDHCTYFFVMPERKLVSDTNFTSRPVRVRGIWKLVSDTNCPGSMKAPFMGNGALEKEKER